MKNGTTLGAVTDSSTNAEIASVQNEKGTVLQRQVTYSDGLGETRTHSVPEGIARLIVRNDKALREQVGDKLPK